MQFKKEKLSLSLTAQAFFFYAAEKLHWSYERKIVVQSLVDIFQNTKDVLCRYDYYIYTPKRVLHLTNSELKIPHLMGLQYIGRPNQYTGDYGVISYEADDNEKRAKVGEILRSEWKSHRGADACLL